MRFLLRLVLLMSLVASAAALSPVAQAGIRTGPSAAVAPSVADGTSPSAGSSSAGSPAEAGPGSPAASEPAPSEAAKPSTVEPVAPTRSPVRPADDPAATTESGAQAAAAAREPAPGVVTQITSQPLNPATTGTATFTYAANVPHDPTAPGATFECRLTGPGRTTATPATCPVDPVTSATTTTGKITYRGLKPSRVPYVFTVQAVIPAGVAPATTEDLEGTSDTFTWRVFTAYAPDSYSPRTGASFNRPLSSAYRRTNLTRIIRTTNSMPGYKEAYSERYGSLCPANAALLPGTIRISLYSLTDLRVANALIAAHRRCVSVHVLMNNHLDRRTDPAWRRLEDAFGTTVSTERRSFAHRCSGGCRGGGVMHTKMYLFNSTVPKSTRNTIVRTMFFGSSNMTQNASKIQYNDLYGIRNDRTQLFDQFDNMFELMSRDNGFRRNPTLPATGIYRATFWPLEKAGMTDPYLTALRQITCTGATGGAGIGGRTVIYINMHAWFGERGLALANLVRSLHNKGCYVRVLYSMMSFTVFKKLARGATSRMSVRRTAFSRNGKTAYVYSHFKNISISGNVGGDRSAKIVYTGSNNFTNFGMLFDEVMVRISSATAYASYVRAFTYNRNRLSSATYANYGEPRGGGRAP